MTARCWSPRITLECGSDHSRGGVSAAAFSGEVRAFPQPRLSLDLAPLRRNPRRARHPTALQSPRSGRSRAGNRAGHLSRGRSIKDGALWKGLPGAGLIALQSGHLCFPWRSTELSSFRSTARYRRAAPRASARRHVHFGSPIRIPERVDGKRVTAEEATHLIMMRIAELLPERYHGVLRPRW